MRNTDHVRNAAIAEAYASGNFLVEHIAKRFNISRRRVQQIAKHYGVVRTRAEGNRAATPHKTKHRIRTKDPRDNPNYQRRGRIPVHAALRQALLRAQPYCTNCPSTLNLEIDHIDNNPMNNLVANLQVLCEPCNRAKAVAFRRTRAEANRVATPLKSRRRLRLR